MSNNSNLDFKLVTYKKKHKVISHLTPLARNTISSDAFNNNNEGAIRRIHEAKEEILTSDFYSSITASLREGFSALGDLKIKEIVCFGLGRIGECMTSRYQLALLLCLKDLFDVKVSVYDPIFAENDLSILRDLDCEIASENSEGKYFVKDNRLTLFYLPHCPKQLSNNLLWANWGLQLHNCVIIANSFTKIIESHPKKVISENAGYLLSISPHMIELAVINTFKYFEIFNDTAIHVFPLRKLSLISNDFWKYRDEPIYPVDDIEFITNKLREL